MRQYVSELANKIDIGKVSGLLGIPEHSITGALNERRCSMCGKAGIIPV